MTQVQNYREPARSRRAADVDLPEYRGLWDEPISARAWAVLLGDETQAHRRVIARTGSLVTRWTGCYHQRDVVPTPWFFATWDIDDDPIAVYPTRAVAVAGHAFIAAERARHHHDLAVLFPQDRTLAVIQTFTVPEAHGIRIFRIGRAGVPPGAHSIAA